MPPSISKPPPAAAPLGPPSTALPPVMVTALEGDIGVDLKNAIRFGCVDNHCRRVGADDRQRFAGGGIDNAIRKIIDSRSKIDGVGCVAVVVGGYNIGRQGGSTVGSENCRNCAVFKLFQK